MASDDLFSPSYVRPPGPGRWLGLLLFFVPYLALAVAGIIWLARLPDDDRSGAGLAAPYWLLWTVPSCFIYLLVVPFLMLRMRRWSPRTIALFGIGTSLLTIGGMIAALAVYRLVGTALGRISDLSFFFVVPFAPAILAIIASYSFLRRRHPTPP